MFDSFDFTGDTFFTAGAIGEPGQRVFYLQMGDEVEYATFKIEKQQVLALAQYVDDLLDDMAPNQDETVMAPPELRPITVFPWPVGTLFVGADLAKQLMVVTAEELLPSDLPSEGEVIDPDPLPEQRRTAKVQISQKQARAFIAAATELSTASRPPCRLCGLPKNPDGHICPRLN